MSAVGRSVERKDGVGKATGAAKYPDDLAFPGMIHGRTIRSTIARGILESVRVKGSVPGLTVVDHPRSRSGDRALLLDLEPDPQVEPDLGAVPQRPDAPTDARGEALARQRRQIAADRDLGDRKRLRKFRNLDGIASLEEPQHVLHPLLLG